MSIVKFQELQITDVWKAKDRERDLGDLTSLEKSISEQGLLQPIVVTTEFQLAAGERRLTACRNLGHETIFAKILPAGVGPDDLVIIEMVENNERKQFEWHEEVKLKLKLHLIWSEASPIPWSYKDTSKKLGVSIGGLSTDLDLAKAISTFPDLKLCQTKGKAREMFKKMLQQAKAIKAMEDLPEEERARIKAMASGSAGKEPQKASKPKEVPTARHEDSEVPLSTIERSLGERSVETPEPQVTNLPDHVYRVARYQDFLKEIPDGSVGLIELDPPYAIDYNTNYDGSRKQQPKANDWTVDTLIDFYEEYLPIFYQKLMDDSWMICWTGKEHFKLTNHYAEEAGFKVQEPGVWAKPGGSTNAPKTNMTSCYEMFLLMRKGNPTFNVPSVHNVWNFSPVHPSNRIHQWEKPLDLCRYILKIMGRQGTIFLTPFAGSGNSMIAAALANMLPMGCDIEEKYIHLFYENFKNYFI